jgi:hypothetical protein
MNESPSRAKKKRPRRDVIENCQSTRTPPEPAARPHRAPGSRTHHAALATGEANRIKRGKPMQAATTRTTTVCAHPHTKPPSASFLRLSPPRSVRFRGSPRLSLLRATAMAATSQQQQEQLIITRPDDWHLHVREGSVLEAVLPHRFARSSPLLWVFGRRVLGVRCNVSECLPVSFVAARGILGGPSSCPT